MLTQQYHTVFDLLAVLCSFFTPEEERKCAMKWAGSTDAQAARIMKKYKQLLDVTLEASSRDYVFDAQEISYVNEVLRELESQTPLEELFLLARLVEGKIGSYRQLWMNSTGETVTALNANSAEIGVSVLPRYHPVWNLRKSSRQRRLMFNAQFQDYMIVRKQDMELFHMSMYILEDDLLFKEEKGEKCLKIALSPVMDAAVLECRRLGDTEQELLVVDGIVNAEAVNSRILQVFEQLFYKDYSMIVFPEALGTAEIVAEIQQRMRIHPEICTYVLLPTICRENQNVLTILGPGGVRILEQRKVTPFYLRDEHGISVREYLKYDNEIHVLASRELGNMVFPICADFLDEEYYSMVSNVILADTVICPSFSPGNGAFKKQLAGGVSKAMFGIWLNSCSAKALSAKQCIAEPVFAVQLPNDEVENGIYYMERECDGKCSEHYCYIDILISYNNNRLALSKELAFCCA